MTMSFTSPFENLGNDINNEPKQQSDECSLTDATNSLSLSPRVIVSEKKRRVSRLTKYHKELISLNRPSLLKTQRLKNRRNIPAFLNKLFNMVDDQSTANLIHWSPNGTSFLVEDHEEFSQVVLPRFFKHNTFSSFVRQLNMYDFHKVPVVQQGAMNNDPKKEIWEFKHPNFQKGRLDLLALVVRKRNKDREQSSNEQIDFPTLFEDVTAIKDRQVEIIESLQSLHTNNEIIWREALELRDKYKKQQHLTSKVLHFLSLAFTGHNAHLQNVLLDLQNSTKSSEIQQKENEPNILENESELKNQEMISATVTQSKEKKNITIEAKYKDQKHMLYSNMFDSASKAAHNISQNMDQLWVDVETLASQFWPDLPESDNNITKDKNSLDPLKSSSKQSRSRQLEIMGEDDQPLFNHMSFPVSAHNDFHIPISNMTMEHTNLRPEANSFYLNLPPESSSMDRTLLCNTEVGNSNTVFNDAAKKDEHKLKKNTQNKLFFINHRPSTVFYK